MKNFSSVLPICCSLQIDTNVNDLWSVISAPGNLNHVHPFCKINEVIVWDDNHHADKLVYLSGRTFIRHFQTWKVNEGYSLFIGEESGPQSYVVWNIKRMEKNKSELSIKVYPYILAKLPKLLAYIPHQLIVKPRMTTYLNSVLGGIAFFIENGKNVPRNHFGTHKWFS